MPDGAWDREVDFLVAGAGPGGMTAALVAALEGLNVLICEKSEQVGGTGATSAGTLWIPENSQSRDAGYIDSANEAGAYLDALIGDGGDARRDAFLAHGPKVIDDLVARTDLQFVACGPHPDYRNNLPGAALSGRAIIPEAFDGRLLGREFRRVRPPIDEFMLFGGIVLALSKFTMLPRNLFTENATQVGSALGVILLSVALADRLNREKKRVFEAQQKLLREGLQIAGTPLWCRTVFFRRDSLVAHALRVGCHRTGWKIR